MKYVLSLIRRVVFNPARARINLPEFLLRAADDFPAPVKYYGARARGALVER